MLILVIRSSFDNAMPHKDNVICMKGDLSPLYVCMLFRIGIDHDTVCHDHHFIKSEENLRFRCLVPLFVPIGVCVTAHNDETASDVIIGMWRHNQEATNHERNGESWFSLPK